MPRDNLSAVDFDRGTGNLYRMIARLIRITLRVRMTPRGTARGLGSARVRNTEPEGIFDEI